MYNVKEIFRSIQGEGYHMGTPCFFIRFAGCNLACDFCDTKETWQGGEEMSSSDILKAMFKELGSSNSPRLVVLTGGEPCLQEDLSDLIDRLHEEGFYVSMETNGTLPTPENIDWVTCSPKQSAEVVNKEYFIHPTCNFNELKYVVTPEFKLSDIREGLFYRKNVIIWLQPESSNMEQMWLNCLRLVEQQPKLRVGCQLHKIMNVR